MRPSPQADLAGLIARHETAEPTDLESLRVAADSYDRIAADLTEALRKAQG